VGSEIQGCEVQVAANGDRDVVVRVAGEIDLATTSYLESAFKSLPPTAANVVLDLAELTFIDAAGLRVAVRAQQRLTARGGSLRLRAPRPLVLRVLAATGLSEEFTIEPTALHD
jgi:stage II sporulation protein AA (anti-sigma F factor antagonist)